MWVPPATISSLARAGDAVSGPPRGWPYTAPTAPMFPFVSCSGRAARSGTSSTATSRSGSNATTVADSVRPVGPITDVECSPATTCAFVTTTPGAATQPLPSWISSQARPATFTVDARTRVLTARLIDVPGGGPGFGGVCSVPSAEGYGASEIARPHAAKRDGCVGPHLSIAATIDEPRAA